MSVHETDIAIIGMSCRLPKSNSVEEFWENLKAGTDCITDLTEEDLIASGVPKELIASTDYVRRRGIIENIDQFDADFFGISPAEAEVMDPQTRIFMECCYEAISNAGYNSYDYKGLIGLFAGCGFNQYFLRYIVGNQELQERMGTYNIGLLNSNDFLTSRVAYKLNLRGPVSTVQTACSTSLVAIHHACQSILNGECDFSLAGGISLAVPNKVGYLYEEGMIGSSDGFCRAFDEKADGTIGSDGSVVVVLKLLERAIEDGDQIHAVIKQSAINNDGSNKAGFTAPSVKGQKNVIEEALEVADIRPNELTYIETHGTGTKLGDPIEFSALHQVFKEYKGENKFCALGAVKTNIGHTDTASGAAGFLKTVLSLYHKQLTPTLHYNSPNSFIDLENSPFYINTELKDWIVEDGSRKAGVSSFGIGGVNAHIILEEAPTPISHASNYNWFVVLLSAKNNTALQQMQEDLKANLEKHPEQSLADICYTLQVGRKAYSHKKAFIVQNKEQLKNALDGNDLFKISKLKNTDTIDTIALSLDVNNSLEENDYLFKEADFDSLNNRLKKITSKHQYLLNSGSKQSLYIDNEYLFLYTLVQLWLSNTHLHWDLLYAHENRKRSLLPSYPMAKKKHWLKENTVTVNDHIPVDWTFHAFWKKQGKTINTKSTFVLFNYNNPITDEFSSFILKQKGTLVNITAGDVFLNKNDDAYVINKDSYEDYNSLLKSLVNTTEGDLKIIFFWGASETNDEANQKFYNMDFLLKAIENNSFDSTIEVGMVSKKIGEIVQEITTNEPQKIPIQNLNQKNIQDKLKQLWEVHLGFDSIGLEDDFFDIGGDSLTATKVIASIRKELGLDISVDDMFDNGTILELSEYMFQEQKVSELPEIQKEERPEKIPLSFNQERLWFLDRLQGSVDYHIPIVLTLPEDIQVDSLNTCFLEILERHESLRTIFKESKGEVYQQQLPVSDWTLNYSDETSLDKPLEEFIDEEINRPFDLSRDLMFRSSLVKRTNENILIIVLHHIASDGWSIPILVEELTTLYRAKQEGIPSNLPKLDIQYADYAIWQHRNLQGEFLEKKLNFWKDKLSGLAPLNLPTDFPRPSRHSGKGAMVYYELKAELKKDVNNLSRNENVTMYMLLLSAFKLLLHNYSRQQDISVGTPIANRQNASVSNLIGYFVNTLVLRSDFTNINTFKELLDQVKATTLSAYAHQDVPFEKVVDAVAMDRDMSRSALFQVMFVLQNNTNISEMSLGDATIEIQEYEHKTAKFDLTFEVTETERGLFVAVEYSTDLFERTTIDRLFKHYECLLSSIVANPHQELGEISMLPAHEKQLLNIFNDTVVAYPEEENILSLFASQVKKRPDSIAVVFEEQELSYKELDTKSNQLADYLKKQFSIQNNDLIGVKLERSEAMVISIMAVLKSGGAYVPIDPSYPKERITYIEKNSECNVCIDLELYEKFLQVQDEYSKKPVSSNRQAHDLAYVIYTSGTTGKPKGVKNTHGALLNRLLWAQDYFVLKPEEDVVLQKTNFCFDVSVWEFFWPLITGVKLVLARPGGHKNIDYLSLLIKSAGITTIHFVPSMLEMFLLDSKISHYPSLQRVLCSGEELTPYQVNKFKAIFKDEVSLFNLYGPTEAAIDVTCWDVPLSSPNLITKVPIGKPVSNTKIYILNEAGNPCAIGVIGELCISGKQVSPGYLNLEDLTKEKFITDPFSQEQEQKYYRTGDLALWLPDGTIEYIGRKDTQVKIRGYRIELSEIELCLASEKQVKQVVVDVKERENDKMLVAYVVADDPLDKEKLKEHLKKELPDYMIPSYFVKLETMPLTFNGKIDRKALPEVDHNSIINQEYVAPKNEIEEVLVSIWEQVIGVERIGVHDNFFEIGGHSLFAMKVHSEIESKLEIHIPLELLFQLLTIVDLANYIVLQKLEEQEKIENETETEEFDL